MEAITGRAPNPKRSGTAAKPLLALWRAAGLPAPDVFVEEVTLIAKWAQCSPDPLAARDIRAVDWTNGKDRSRSPHTLAVQDRYDERLNAARDWQDAGCPVANDDGAQASAPRWGLTTTTRGTSPEWELLQCLKRYGGIPGQLRDLHTDADRAKQHAEALRRLGDGHAGRGLKVMSEAFLAANKGSLGEMEHRYRDAFRAVVRGAA